jgi:KaiC/GvpD/RAD55 family RecA-like ATPase
MISGQIVYLSDFNNQADQLRASYGRTDRHSTGSPDLDGYLGGGYGRDHGYEIVLLFGDTGLGKSIFGLNLIHQPVVSGKTVGLLVLEDSGPDVNIRLSSMFGRRFVDEYRKQLLFTPDDVTNGRKLWALDQLIEQIDSWFTNLNIDVILLDHLQFAFESATSLRGDNEYIAQRVFVRKLNAVMKRLAGAGLSRTIILVCHTNKDKHAKGLSRVIGSGGIAGSATKAIELSKLEDTMFARLWKSRFTPTPDFSRAFYFDARQRLAGPNRENYHEEEVNSRELPTELPTGFHGGGRDYLS